MLDNLLLELNLVRYTLNAALALQGFVPLLSTAHSASNADSEAWREAAAAASNGKGK